MKPNGAFGKGNHAPKAGALPGCATPRLHSFYTTSQTETSLCARGFDTDTPAFCSKFGSTVSKPLQIESTIYRGRLNPGWIGPDRWSVPPTICRHSSVSRRVARIWICKLTSDQPLTPASSGTISRLAPVCVPVVRRNRAEMDECCAQDGARA
jgi:hypothetical protein